MIRRSLSGLSAAIRKVTLGVTDQVALRRDIIAPLSVLAASARALDVFTRGLEWHNSTANQSALRLIFAGGTAVKPLLPRSTRRVSCCQKLLAELVPINQSAQAFAEPVHLSCGGVSTTCNREALPARRIG